MSKQEQDSQNIETEDISSEIVQIIESYKTESSQASITRRAQTNLNYDTFNSIQDWSEKIAGQSTEFLPKMSLAVRQFANFIRKGLIGSSDWFEAEVKGGWLTETDVFKLMLTQLKGTNFPTAIMDSVSVGSLSGLCVLKVFPKEVSKGWQILVEPVNTMYYFPDPTGRDLYEIQLLEKDFYAVAALCNSGKYIKTAIESLTNSGNELPEKSREQARENQNPSTAANGRNPVTITEFWGTLLRNDGSVLKENCRVVLGNGKVILKNPTPFPYWFKESCFVRTPLNRIPFSTYHKALFDDAVSLNLAANELFNLILDGGLNAAWGAKTVRSGDLSNPEQVSQGIPAGTTLIIKDEVPRGTKVLTVEKLGEVPADALNMYNLIDREFEEASMINSIKLGSIPARKVLATEVIKSDENSSVLLDGVIAQIETFASEALRKMWLLMMQYIQSLDMDDLINALGVEKAVKLTLIDKEERKRLAELVSFRVKGISVMSSKVKTFQKLMALMQAVSQNAIMGKAFLQTYDLNKFLSLLIRSLDINPDDIKLSMEDAQSAIKQEVAIPSASADNKGISHEMVGDMSLASEINQQAQPTGGF